MNSLTSNRWVCQSSLESHQVPWMLMRMHFYSSQFIWMEILDHLPTSDGFILISHLRRMFQLSSCLHFCILHIDTSYCGRILQTTVTNSKGSSMRSTNVTVLCKLIHKVTALIAGRFLLQISVISKSNELLCLAG